MDHPPTSEKLTVQPAPRWKNGLILLLLAGYFVIRCFYLDAVPRWDASRYWVGLAHAIVRIQAVPTPAELPGILLETLNVFGHPAMGYYFLLTLGQLIDFPNQWIINLTNILLAMFSIGCFYLILRRFFGREEHLPEVLLATAAYAFEPLFFATSIFLNLDFPLLVFLTAALCSLVYGRYGLFSLASLFMIFSKEPGILFYAAMAGAPVLHAVRVLAGDLRDRRRPLPGLLFTAGYPAGNRDDALPATWPAATRRALLILLPGVVFLVYMVLRRGALWVDVAGLKFDSSGWNCFGFNGRVMLNRLGEIFVLDFHWVAALVLTVCLALVLGRRILSRSDDGGEPEKLPAAAGFLIPSPFVASFAIFVAFNLLYITFIIPRYVVEGGFFLLLFDFFALRAAFPRRSSRLAILALLFGLFFVQTFRTVDPLSKLAFGRAPFGPHEILQIDSPGEAVGNGFVYNSEFTMVDKLFNRMQKAMPMSPDTVLIAWDADRYYAWFQNGTVYVDATTLDRTVRWKNSFRYNVLNIYDLTADNAPLEAYYLYMPWLSVFSNEEAELAQVRTLYTVSAPTTIDIQGYFLRYYRLVRKTARPHGASIMN
jgi:hypothetical protein